MPAGLVSIAASRIRCQRLIPFTLSTLSPRQTRGRNDARQSCLGVSSLHRHKSPNLTGIDPITKEIVPLFHPRRSADSPSMT